MIATISYVQWKMSTLMQTYYCMLLLLFLPLKDLGGYSIQHYNYIKLYIAILKGGNSEVIYLNLFLVV